MVPQPLLRDVSGAALDDVGAAAGPGVDEHGRIDLAAAQREVIDLSGVRTNFCQVFAGSDVHDGV
jgi:hypothetical protein